MPLSCSFWRPVSAFGFRPDRESSPSPSGGSGTHMRGDDRIIALEIQGGSIPSGVNFLKATWTLTVFLPLIEAALAS